MEHQAFSWPAVRVTAHFPGSFPFPFHSVLFPSVPSHLLHMYITAPEKAQGPSPAALWRVAVRGRGQSAANARPSLLDAQSTFTRQLPRWQSRFRDSCSPGIELCSTTDFKRRARRAAYSKRFKAAHALSISARRAHVCKCAHSSSRRSLIAFRANKARTEELPK